MPWAQGHMGERGAQPEDKQRRGKPDETHNGKTTGGHHKTEKNAKQQTSENIRQADNRQQELGGESLLGNPPLGIFFGEAVMFHPNP